MTITNLSKEYANLFDMFDPFEFLSLLESPTAFALGGIEGEGNDITPVALLIGTATPKMLTIAWLAVSPDYQGQGFGEQPSTLLVAKLEEYRALS